MVTGGPGAGKGTQAPVLAGRLGLVHVSTGDLFRAALRDGTPLGAEGQVVHGPRPLVPDDVTVEHAARAPGPAGRGRRRDPRRLPAHAAQAEALDRALAGEGQSVEVAPYIEVERGRAGPPARPSRWVCRASGHVYHAHVLAAEGRGVCDIDGARARTSATTTSPTSCAPASSRSCRRCTRSSTTTGARRARQRRRRPGDRRGDRGARRRSSRGARRLELMAPPLMVTLKCASEIDKMAVAGRSSPTCSRSSSPSSGPASRRSSSTGSRRDTSARRAPTPSFIGVPRLPRPRCASRSTTRSSTASPASGSSARARSSRSTRAPSSTAGTATAHGRSSSATSPSPRSTSSSRRRGPR